MWTSGFSAFQHAAARRRLDDVDVAVIAQIKVSTRSRPKAAGVNFGYIATAQVSFNTQPPEGGWPCALIGWQTSTTFQHAAARRRLGSKSKTAAQKADVSTRSRPKAAGVCDRTQLFQFQVSTRSRPKAAGLILCCSDPERLGFNTQPPEGGWTTAHGIQTR